MHLLSRFLAFTAKKETFGSWPKLERREALSIPGAKRSPKGRGSEHGAHLFFAPRGAAQAGLTEGAERSSKFGHEPNVKWLKDRPKAAPRIWRLWSAVTREKSVSEFAG